MELELTWVNILILFGAIQGTVFSGILVSHRNHPGRLFLVFVMVALVYNAMETFNWSARLDQYTMFFDFFPFVTIFLVGPSFYLYYKSVLLQNFRPSKGLIVLVYGPFLFQLFYAGVNFLGNLAYSTLGWSSLETPLGWMFRVYDFYSEAWSLVVFLFFTFLAFRFVRGHLASTMAQEKPVQTLQWVKHLLAFQLVFALGWTFTLLAPLWYNGEFGPHYYPLELLLVVFLYWIALAGYGKVKSIQHQYPNKPKEPNPMAFGILESLHAVLDNDRLFLNPNLSLQMLADRVGISPREISYALNKAGNTNFNDFVNKKRVEEFCNRLAKESKSKLTIFGMAQECGFNSPATFQRAFKKTKKMNPKAYLSQNVNTSL